MEKLTLRQFSDVIKALVEASVTKEAGKLDLVLETSKAEDGEQISLVCKKEQKKEDEKKIAGVDVSSKEVSFVELYYDMNSEYRNYELELLHNTASPDEIIRKIADKIAYDMVSSVKEIGVDKDVAKEEPKEAEESSKETCKDDCKNDCKCDCKCDEDDDEFFDDDDDEDCDWYENDCCDCCSKIVKIALVCAAVPLGIMIFKKLKK